MTDEGMSLEEQKTHHIIVWFSLENCWDGFRQTLAACKHELSDLSFLLLLFCLVLGFCLVG